MNALVKPNPAPSLLDPDSLPAYPLPSELHGHSKFTQEKAEFILSRLEQGMMEANILQLPEAKQLFSECFPATAIDRWRATIPAFAMRYDLARKVGNRKMLADCVEIADDSRGDAKIDRHGNVLENTEFTRRSELRVNTRLRVLAILEPETYGVGARGKAGAVQVQVNISTGVRRSPVAVVAAEAEREG